MYKGKRILAVVTARGGSKGLPGKNIKVLNKKPLVVWTIEAAKKSAYIDRVFVSTDSVDIAKVCDEAGAPVESLRPKALAEDSSSSVDVLLYTIEYLEKKGEKFDYLILLEPTSPLRKDSDIDCMIELALDHTDADGCISVGKVHLEHPSIVKKVNRDGFISPYIDNGIAFYQRQQEDEALFPYGVGYLIRIDVLKKERSLYTERMLPYSIERWQTYEIDDIYDFECISTIMKMEKNRYE